MLSINLETPTSVLTNIKNRFKERRLQFNLTQEGLSKKSGVSLGSLKRFESSGKISLDSLLQLAVVLDCLEDFNQICKDEITKYNSLEDIIKEKPQRRRGSIK